MGGRKTKGKKGFWGFLKKRISNISRKTVVWTLIISLAIGGAAYILLNQYSAAAKSTPAKTYSSLKVCQQNVKAGCVNYFNSIDKKKTGDRVPTRAQFMVKATASEKNLYAGFRSQFLKIGSLAQKTKDVDQCANVQRVCRETKTDFEQLLNHKFTGTSVPTHGNVLSQKPITTLGKDDKAKLASCRANIKKYASKAKTMLNSRDTKAGSSGFWANFWFVKNPDGQTDTLRKRLVEISPEASGTDVVMAYASKIVSQNNNVNLCVQEEIAAHVAYDSLLKITMLQAKKDGLEAAKAEALIVKKRNITMVALAVLFVIATAGYGASVIGGGAAAAGGGTVTVTAIEGAATPAALTYAGGAAPVMQALPAAQQMLALPYYGAAAAAL